MVISNGKSLSFKCLECHKQFKTKFSLTRHFLTVHLGEKRFKCEVCGRRFGQKQYLIDHYCWICINPKEADDLGLSREVISFIPEFLDKPTVLGIGEIGLNLNTPNELTVFEEQVDLALK